MWGTIISGGILVSIFAIAAPFIFVLLVIRMVTGGKSRKPEKPDSDDMETLDEVYRGLKDLNRRIDNLETLYKKNRKE
jgi:hypothetical protein